MSFIAINTDNPLGRRPLNLMARSQALGWLGDMAAAPTPGDYDNNQAVLNQLVSMGAISFQDATDIFNGQASLDDMAVNMTMINQALQMTGQSGASIPAPLPGALPASSASGGNVDASSEGSWNTALNTLQQWNATLKQVASIAMQHPNDPSWASLDRDLLNNQNQYNSAVAQFNDIYRAVYGHVAPGLSGDFLGWLGQFDPVSAVGYAALLIAVTGAAIAGYEYAQALRTRAQAQLQQQQTAGTIANQAAAAYARGDTATGDALMARATTTSTAAETTSFTAFLQKNAAMLALVALGIVALPPLIKKL
jgi:hypothetical protein